jgi:hypothetical protein
MIDGPLRYPSTRDEMIEWGYKYTRLTNCKKCGGAVEWWVTPNGKRVAMNAGSVVGHWKTNPGCFDRMGHK